MDDDDLWARDGREFGWKLPPPAAAWKRTFVVRISRAWYAHMQSEKFPEAVAWYAPQSGYDQWVIYAIQRGWC